MSDSLWPHGLQHSRLPCPSTTPGACSNSSPWSRWCHPTISSSVVPFSSRLQSFPASGSFPRSQFFTSGGQSIRTSASASVLNINIQDWFPLGLTGWLSLQSKGLSRVFSNTTVLWLSAFFIVQLSHTYMTTRKTIALTRWTFVSKVMSLLFNMLSRLAISFLPRSKHLLVSCLQLTSAMILEPPKIKSLFPLCPHIFAMKWWDQMASGIRMQNAKVGSQDTPGVTGKFSLGEQNESGKWLIEFCQKNALIIANTHFQQHKRWLYTWISPNGQYQNQTDYILCS